MSSTGARAKYWPDSDLKSYESKTLINARKCTVWDIITDGGNYTVWNSGITHIDGELRHGGTIRVRTPSGGNRMFRIRVRQIPGEVMTWTGGMPFALFKSVRTFTLTPDGGKTLLHVRQDFAGPLQGLLWNAVPDIEKTFAEYLSAVKKRAELLSRHEARIHASLRRPWGAGRTLGSAECPRHSALVENAPFPRPASASTHAPAAGPVNILPVGAGRTGGPARPELRRNPDANATALAAGYVVTRSRPRAHPDPKALNH